MVEERHTLNSEDMDLPPFQSVLGEVPSPNPERRKTAQQAEDEMYTAIRRLIGHLKEEQRRAGYY